MTFGGQWHDYDENITEKLESVWGQPNRKSNKVPVDDERYVDLSTMMQCRYDDRFYPK
jgi:hypothetical protein